MTTPAFDPFAPETPTEVTIILTTPEKNRVKLTGLVGHAEFDVDYGPDRDLETNSLSVNPLKFILEVSRLVPNSMGAYWTVKVEDL